MKYSMNLMTANPFSPSPGTPATAQFQKQPLLQTSLKELNHFAVHGIKPRWGFDFF